MLEICGNKMGVPDPDGGIGLVVVLCAPTEVVLVVVGAVVAGTVVVGAVVLLEDRTTLGDAGRVVPGTIEAATTAIRTATTAVIPSHR